MSKHNWQQYVQKWIAKNGSQRGLRSEMSNGDSVLELSIMDFIGEDFFGDGITAEGIKHELDKHINAKRINVLINSPGGIITEGIAIHSLLSRRKADGVQIDVEVLGEASSMASVIAMVGSTITMHPGSFMMVHEGSGFAFGNADDFRASADMLDTLTGGSVDIYVARTGLSRDKVVSLMKAETFMSAEEAKDLGFADEIAGAEVGEQTQGNTAAAQRVFGFAAVAHSSGRPRGKNMTDFSKVALLLGLTAEASQDSCESKVRALVDRSSVLDSIESATGKKGDEALGVVTAWKGSHEELGPLKIDLAEQKAVAEKAELDSLIEGARSGSGYDDKKPRLTSKQADTIREQVEAKEMSVKAVKAQLATAHPVAHLSTKVPKAGAPQATSDEPWRGKVYGDLKPTMRAKLKHANPELLESMKADSELKG